MSGPRAIACHERGSNRFDRKSAGASVADTTEWAGQSLIDLRDVELVTGMDGVQISE